MLASRVLTTRSLVCQSIDHRALCVSRRCNSTSVSDVSGQWCNMAERSFWDARYSGERCLSRLEWFIHNPNHLIPHLHPYITAAATASGEGAVTVLDIGCGTSQLPAAIARAYPNATVQCVDFSAAALQRGADRGGERLHYVVGDASHLPYRDATFDLILDKGLLDTVLRSRHKGENKGVVRKAETVLRELLRVLSPAAGYMIQISDEDPDLRMPVYEAVEEAGVGFGGGLLRRRVSHVHLSLDTEDAGVSPSLHNVDDLIQYYMYVYQHNLY